MQRTLCLILSVLLVVVAALAVGQWVTRTDVSAATPINFGEVISASIASVGESDNYTFSGDVNDTVLVRLEDTGGETSFYAKMGLYAPDGSLVASQYSTGSYEVQQTLAASGTYSILVSDENLNSTGTYNVYIERINNPSSSTPITYGNVTSGSINSSPEVKVYTFSGDVNDTVLIRLEDTGAVASFYAKIRLYAPDGSLVASQYSTGSYEVQQTLATSGTYSILVSDENLNSTGTYELVVTRRNATQNQPPDQPGNVSPSETASGVSVAPTLGSTSFSDPDAGDSQAASQWQVTSVSGDYSSPVYDSGEDSSNLNEMDVPAGILQGNTTYYWRVRYQDSGGNWSEWSAETRFRTTNDSFTDSVALPGEAFKDPETTVFSGIFAVIFVLVFYFAATLFNSTFKENYGMIHEWIGRVSRQLGSIDRNVREKTSGLPHFSGRMKIYLRAAAIVILSAILYSLIDPSFGFNVKGLAFFVAMVVSVGIVTLAYEGVQVVLMTRRFSIPAGFKFFWMALIIAAICVGTSRAIDFHPGIIYGFVGAATVLSVKRPDKRQESVAILLGTAVLLAAAICAFYMRGLTQNAADRSDHFWVLLGNFILTITCVMGLEGLLFTLLPLPFMDGGKVAAWKWWVAVAALSLVVFFFVSIIVIKGNTLGEAASDVKMIVMAALMPLCLVVSGGFWLYFWLRRRNQQRREEAAPGLVTSGGATDTMALQTEGGIGLSGTLDEVLQAMSARVEKNNHHTASHQRRVTDLAHAIAVELGLSGEQSRAVRLAGMLHDVGKMLIPGELLSKPGRLTDTEFETVRTHSRAGSEMLKEMKVPSPIVDIVEQHHERIDGSGYPSGLKGDQSALEARILAVADVVEAMSSERPYRPAFSVDKALEEIVSNRGKLYDAGVVDACLAVFRKGSFRFADQSI
jgi:putative nucleotidyltransferase with HDIG domain